MPAPVRWSPGMPATRFFQESDPVQVTHLHLGRPHRPTADARQ
jgi:hypothetical protein